MKPFAAATKSLLLGLALLSSPAALAERPNIVLVLADDLGHGDLACFGAKEVETAETRTVCGGGAGADDHWTA